MKEELNDENFIGLICTGEFNAIPDFKIGELFESFFDNINYNVIKENEEVYVDFTGEAMCDDKPCTILIRFKIYDNGDEFEIDKVMVNDEILDEDETMDLLEDIAYVGGAILEDEDNEFCDSCSTQDCNNCMYECEENEEDDEIDENKDNLNNNNDDEK